MIAKSFIPISGVKAFAIMKKRVLRLVRWGVRGFRDQ
jgi:hypothetical protein